MQIQFTKQAREELLRIVSVFAEFAGTRSVSLHLNQQELLFYLSRHQDNHLDCRYMGQAPESFKIDSKGSVMTIDTIGFVNDNSKKHSFT